MEVLEQFDLRDKVPVVGLAKREEEVFKPGRKTSVRFDPAAPAILLLRRIRDEAHRFANTGHRRRRSKVGVASILDSIPGVGPRRRQKLLTHFGSLDDLRRATMEEIASVPGIPAEVARAVKSHLA